MGGIVISAALLARLRAEAAATPAVEVCGLLFGSAGRIEAAEATANVAADPAIGFEVDPARLLAAHRAQRGGGRALVGHYHSHPSGCARPSAADREAADGAALWLILAGGAARLWRIEGGRFVAVALIAG